MEGANERDVEWDDAYTKGYGCGECEWSGREEWLVKIGIDGEPLPDINPDQIKLGYESG